MTSDVPSLDHMRYVYTLAVDLAGGDIVKARDDFDLRIRQAEITALRTYADQLGVYVGYEEGEFYRGYRQAQREAMQDADRYIDRIAAGGDPG